jgi:hypothetical protein
MHNKLSMWMKNSLPYQVFKSMERFGRIVMLPLWIHLSPIDCFGTIGVALWFAFFLLFPFFLAKICWERAIKTIGECTGMNVSSVWTYPRKAEPSKCKSTRRTWLQTTTPSWQSLRMKHSLGLVHAIYAIQSLPTLLENRYVKYSVQLSTPTSLIGFPFHSAFFALLSFGVYLDSNISDKVSPILCKAPPTLTRTLALNWLWRKARTTVTMRHLIQLQTSYGQHPARSNYS